MKRIMFIAVLATAPFLMGAQRVDTPVLAPQLPGAAPVFKSESELVVVHVAVRDRDGAPVAGLPVEAFRLLENGRPQPISLFARDREPVTVGLVLDVSGSMGSTRARLSYAASKFAETATPGDEIFAIVVGDTPTPALPPGEPFTSDPTTLRVAIARAHRPGGMTALYDAIAAGLDYLERGTHARRALVVMSDGVDNASQLTFDQVLRRTQASNAAVYAVGLVDPVSVARDPGHLKQLARATGGDAYFPPTNADAVDALDGIARQIRNAYALGFVPTTAERDGRHHRLDVTVRAPDGRKVSVRARAGYLSGGSTN